MKITVQPRPPRLFLPTLALLMSSASGTPYCLGQTGTVTNSHSAQPADQKSTPSGKVQSGPPACPSDKFLPIRLSPPANASHRVILSWSASKPTPDHPAKAAGYCLYKSQTKLDETKFDPSQPGCSTCEPLNSVAVTGTSCIDDIVENGATYYYVATAVNDAGTPGRWSNVATAPITSSNPITIDHADSPTPVLCRVTSPPINILETLPGR